MSYSGYTNCGYALKCIILNDFFIQCSASFAWQWITTNIPVCSWKCSNWRNSIFLTNLCHLSYACMVFLCYRPYMYSLLWKRVEVILISKIYYRQEIAQKDGILPYFWVDQKIWLQKKRYVIVYGWTTIRQTNYVNILLFFDSLKPLLDVNGHQNAEDDLSDDEQNQKVKNKKLDADIAQVCDSSVNLLWVCMHRMLLFSISKLLWVNGASNCCCPCVSETCFAVNTEAWIL